MQHFQCSKCKEWIPEIGGYEIENNQVICQICKNKNGVLTNGVLTE